ncbi:MAG: hypothetical protein QF918_06800 [Pirellulaceae bacterium]|nr:hypothetical protein [Pirellulaceae bacterium]MDP6554931.1 hypothetical protein [Pirellulaceae bacterium]
MSKPRRCVALLSGGLDSMLVIRIMQAQGIEVEALNFKTVFTCCQDQSAQTARDLGVRMTVVGQEDDYLDLVRKPMFGYGKGANPCVDCRIYMFERAKAFMEQIGADFIVSGEVVGQRPMSQKRKDLNVISYHSDLEDLLLRPLSAKFLPMTLPEREGWVDREKLYAFQGRSRKGLIKLAKQFGFEDIPTPSTGCSLTEPRFSKKVFDLFEMPTLAQRWDFDLLKHGRHFRFDEEIKVILGRNLDENQRLVALHEAPDASSTAILCPDNFYGPHAIVVGPPREDALKFAAALTLRYARDVPESPLVKIDTADGSRIVVAQTREDAEQIHTVATM